MVKYGFYKTNSEACLKDIVSCHMKLMKSKNNNDNAASSLSSGEKKRKLDEISKSNNDGGILKALNTPIDNRKDYDSKAPYVIMLMVELDEDARKVIDKVKIKVGDDAHNECCQQDDTWHITLCEVSDDVAETLTKGSSKFIEKFNALSSSSSSEEGLGFLEAIALDGFMKWNICFASKLRRTDKMTSQEEPLSRLLDVFKDYQTKKGKKFEDLHISIYRARAKKAEEKKRQKVSYCSAWEIEKEVSNYGKARGTAITMKRMGVDYSDCVILANAETMAISQ